MANNAKVGGILSIVAGGFGAVGALIFLVIAIVMVGVNNWGVNEFGEVPPDAFFDVFAVVYAIIALLGLCVCALAIVGGVYGMKRKNWGLALAGAIAAAVVFFPAGVVAIVFTAISKPEFDAAQTPAVRPI